MSISVVGKEGEKLNLDVAEYQGLTWYHAVKPTKAELKYLSELFPFHSENLENVLRHHLTAKIDEYDSHLFIVLHFPIYDEETRAVISCELDVFIGEGYLITVDSSGRLRGLTTLIQACQSDEKIRKERMNRGSGYLLFLILEDRIDRRLVLLDRIGNSIESVEEKVFCERVQDARGVVRELSALRRDVMSFRRALWTMRAIVHSLGTKVSRYTQMDMRDYFSDLDFRMERMWDALEECKEIAEGLHDTYNSMATSRTNDILRILTVVMTIGSILTAYVGYYGMNIPLGPLGGADPGGNPLAWLYLLVVGVVLAGLMIVYAIRKGWL